MRQGIKERSLNRNQKSTKEATARTTKYEKEVPDKTQKTQKEHLNRLKEFRQTLRRALKRSKGTKGLTRNAPKETQDQTNNSKVPRAQTSKVMEKPHYTKVLCELYQTGVYMTSIKEKTILCYERFLERERSKVISPVARGRRNILPHSFNQRKNGAKEYVWGVVK